MCYSYSKRLKVYVYRTDVSAVPIILLYRLKDEVAKTHYKRKIQEH